MKKNYISIPFVLTFLLLGVFYGRDLFKTNFASAAPTSTIVQALRITTLGSTGNPCLVITGVSGAVSTSTCGGIFTTTTIAGLVDTSFVIRPTSTVGISTTTSPSTIWIGPDQSYATSSLPSGNNTEIQFNDNNRFGGNSKLTYTSSTGVLKANATTTVFEFPLIVGTTTASTSPLRAGTSTIPMFAVGTSSQPAFWVDQKTGDVHIGWKDEYTSGFRYRDSRRLYFDNEYERSGINTTYIDAVPNSAGVQQQFKMRFFVDGASQLEISGVGGIVFPNGAQFANSSTWLISGNTMRTTNTSPGTIRGEFNTVTIQGETNTSGSYDTIILGKNPFGGNTASRIVGFQNNSVTQGYINTFGGMVLNETATSSAAADFQVKSQPNANALRVVASTSNVGIGTSTPQSSLQMGTPNDNTNTYLQLDVATSTPISGDCTSSTVGRMIFFATSTLANEKLYICGVDSGNNPTWTSQVFN